MREKKKKKRIERGIGGLNSLCGIKKWTVLCEKNRKRVGSLLTYDTALQVVSRTAQKDLFLDLRLLGSHFIGLFLLAGVEATGKRWEVGGAKAEAGARMAHGKSRTSCGSIDDTKEEDGGNGVRRDAGCPRYQWARSMALNWKRRGKGG